MLGWNWMGWVAGVAGIAGSIHINSVVLFLFSFSFSFVILLFCYSLLSFFLPSHLFICLFASSLLFSFPLSSYHISIFVYFQKCSAHEQYEFGQGDVS
jgi:hypothetical protein